MKACSRTFLVSYTGVWRRTGSLKPEEGISAVSKHLSISIVIKEFDKLELGRSMLCIGNLLYL
jgi:hypothetical protein